MSTFIYELTKRYGQDILLKLRAFRASTFGCIVDGVCVKGTICFHLDPLETNYVKAVALTHDGFPVWEFVKINGKWFRVDKEGLTISDPTVFPFVAQPFDDYHNLTAYNEFVIVEKASKHCYEHCVYFNEKMKGNN